MKEERYYRFPTKRSRKRNLKITLVIRTFVKKTDQKKDNRDDKNGLKKITETHLFHAYESQQLKVKKDFRHFKLSIKGKKNGKIRRITARVSNKQG